MQGHHHSTALPGRGLTCAAGGRGNIDPVLYILDSLKNDSKYPRKTFGILSRINVTSSTKISEKSVQNVLRKWCYSDNMFHYFRSKNGKCLKMSRMYRFEVNCNPQNAKRRKIEVSTKWLSHIFRSFDPQNSKHPLKNKCL